MINFGVANILHIWEYSKRSVNYARISPRPIIIKLIYAQLTINFGVTWKRIRLTTNFEVNYIEFFCFMILGLGLDFASRY